MVVSWFREWGKILDRPSKPKRVVNWERQGEAPVQGIVNSHLRRSFSSILVEVGGIELEWAVFKASIAEVAVVSCGLRSLGSSRGGNPGSMPIQSTCVLWIWRRSMTVPRARAARTQLLLWEYRDWMVLRSDPLTPCSCSTSHSQFHSQWVLASARATLCHQSCL